MDKAREAQGVPFKRLRIISTEDDTLIRLILAELVSPEGHEMQFAKNGEDLFNLLGKKNCDVLILDVNVPGMNGYQIAREICARYKEQRPKILIFTGRDTEAEKGLALVSGADAVLKKGCPLELLLETINRLGGNGKPPAAAEVPAAKAAAPAPSSTAPREIDPATQKRLADLEQALRGLAQKTTSLGERMDRMAAPPQG